MSPVGNNLFAMCTPELEPTNVAKNLKKQNKTNHRVRIRERNRTIGVKVLLTFIVVWDSLLDPLPPIKKRGLLLKYF